jgi:membrane associated rhomboid family serine protease
MLIPIGLDHTIRRWPYVTIAIIVVCTLVQIYSSVFAPSFEEVRDYARERLLERRIHENDAEQRAEDTALARDVEQRADEVPIIRLGYTTGTGLTWRLLACTFVHAGWLHLIGNMLFLWLVGASLEDRWGAVRFALFYAFGAAASTYAFDRLSGDQETLLVGASGAISTLMGAFLVCFTHMRIRMFYWLFFRAGTFEIVAYVALPLWLLEQFIEKQLQSSDGIESVAYTAHIAGFLLGFAVALVVRLVPEGDRRDRARDGAGAELPRAVATPVPPKLPAPALDRFEQCMRAIGRRDLGVVRTTASRVILDLARVGEHRRILEIYDAMVSNLSTIPLTDGAFAAVATAADRTGKRHDYVAIANALSREHPYSTHTPQVLWRLAEIHRELGQPELAMATLKDLSKRFPRDRFGQRAAAELGE